MDKIIERLKKLDKHIESIIDAISGRELSREDMEVFCIVLETAINELNNQRDAIYSLMNKNA